jgi:hypothetical protein
MLFSNLCLGFRSGLIPSGFWTKFHLSFSSLHNHPVLITQTKSNVQYTSWSSSLYSLLHSPFISSLLIFHVFLRTLFSNTPGICSTVNIKNWRIWMKFDIYPTKFWEFMFWAKFFSRWVRGHMKCDGTRAETIFRLSAKRTCPFKSTRVWIQSTNVSRVVPISGSNASCTMFRGSAKSTGYPLYSPVSPLLPSPPCQRPCFTECHHISSRV